MKRIYVNEEWCLGCHLCEYVCAFANSGLKDMATALKGWAGIYTSLIREQTPLDTLNYLKRQQHPPRSQKKFEERSSEVWYK